MARLIMKVLLILMLNISGHTDEIPRWAQEKTPVKMSYYLGLGTSFPSGDLADNWKQGFHGYGRMDFSASPKLSIWVGADYHFFPHEVVADTGFEGGNFSSINLTGDFKVNFGTAGVGINPYLFAGMGLAIRRISDSTYHIPGDTLNGSLISTPARSNSLIEIGGGVEYKMFFIQSRYLNNVSDITSVGYIPITLGVKF